MTSRLSRRIILSGAAASLLADVAPSQQPAPNPFPPPVRPAPLALSAQKLVATIPIPKQSGRAVVVQRDQRVKVINPRGKQVGDLFAFNRSTADEFIAPAYTLTRNRHLYLEPGRPLLSNYENQLLVLEENTVGRMDLLYPACSGSQKPGVLPNLPNCRDNMQAALRAIGFPVPVHPEIVHPHNLFQNSPVIDLDGHIEVREPTAKAGDYVLLRALEPLVVVVTACSVPGRVNGNEPKELLLEVYA
jgi:uncharacterized protein YcgI (DUF1989 family)